MEGKLFLLPHRTTSIFLMVINLLVIISGKGESESETYEAQKHIALCTVTVMCLSFHRRRDDDDANVAGKREIV